MIRQTPGVVFDIVLIGPERYNDLYEKFGNLNSLLGWGHARVIENLLAKRPDCPRALSDKFADARVIEKALLQHGQHIQLEQRTKAESDLAVAAASILAREAFIDWLEHSGKQTWPAARPWRLSGHKRNRAQDCRKGGIHGSVGVSQKSTFAPRRKWLPDDFAAPPPRREWRRQWWKAPAPTARFVL